MSAAAELLSVDSHNTQHIVISRLPSSSVGRDSAVPHALPFWAAVATLSAAAAFSMCSEYYQDNLVRFLDHPHERRPFTDMNAMATRYGQAVCLEPGQPTLTQEAGELRPGPLHFLRHMTIT